MKKDDLYYVKKEMLKDSKNENTLLALSRLL